MEIGSASSKSPTSEAQVAVFNKEKDQQEKVVGKILQGVEQPVNDGSGDRLLAVA